MSIGLDRVPPQNVDAERSVLGSLIIGGENMALVSVVISVLLNAEPFYREAHKSIFDAILSLYENGLPITLLSVAEQLDSTGLLQKVGGVPYIDEMADSVPTPPSPAAVEYEAKLVYERYIRRKLIYISAEAYYKAYDQTEELDVVMAEIEKAILDIKNEKPLEGLAPAKRQLKESFKKLRELYETKDQVTGIPTGFLDLDSRTTGLQAGEYVLVAGRPSMGKSSLVQDIARYAAISEKVPTAFFSLEMSGDNLVRRLLCAEAGVQAHKMRTGFFSESDWPNLTYAAGRISEAPLWIDSSIVNIKPMQVRARCMKLYHTTAIGLIIIDYIQLMQADTATENRNQQLTQISASLKNLGRELNVPMVVVSQLSREPEKRQDKRPMLSDLRESGSLEQDADLVLFLYRDSYYDRTNMDDTTELIIAKQRNGPVGTVKLLFDKQRIRFLNRKEESDHGSS